MKRQVNLALALGRHRRRVRPLLRRNMTKSPSQPISGCALTRQKLLHHLTDEREMLLCDAMRIIGSRDRAEDVVQDAAVRCLNSTRHGSLAPHLGPTEFTGLRDVHIPTCISNAPPPQDPLRSVYSSVVCC